jgi:hypothetical protein
MCAILFVPQLGQELGRLGTTQDGGIATSGQTAADRSHRDTKRARIGHGVAGIGWGHFLQPPFF